MSEPALRALPRLCFVHVPKTGGMAVTETLAKLYGPATCPAMTTLDYARYDTDSFAAYRFYRGHAYRRDYRRLPGDTRLLMILRDPVRRALSQYWYFRRLDQHDIGDPFMREAIDVARTCSFTDFVHSDSPFVVEHVRLAQVRQFLPQTLIDEIGHRQFLSRGMRRAVCDAFHDELSRFDAALTTGWLPRSLPTALRDLGLRARLDLSLVNATEPYPDSDYGDALRVLVDVNCAEFACYRMVADRERATMMQISATSLAA
jgi:hypothetical protein